MRKRLRLVGVTAALMLLLAPVPAVAGQEPGPPVTVPALFDWTPASGSYALGPGARLVADDPAERRVAGTLTDDLRAAATARSRS
ncbi:hypothetical protein [Streptomyces resistomycificus]|uniref:Uncharacterized protein n=1 Tax=Streptomyces resistomycificus TaxID=67356 RepID=A0A0L8L0M0_9ACTN|nr:hypothetical protein ADK37_29750 [Streptomyces resistomycificus]KUN95615.1 hypothetical protein AQJ84_22705 [Streptomyces resistomycificus]